jgi:hypothetical protein
LYHTGAAKVKERDHRGRDKQPANDPASRAYAVPGPPPGPPQETRIPSRAPSAPEMENARPFEPGVYRKRSSAISGANRYSL